jgi:hypothetical protein
MLHYTHYYTRVRGLGTSWTGLPGWARMVVGLLAVPGLVLGVLSVFAFALSILVLLVLTLPAYAVLRRLVGLFPRKREVVHGVEVLDEDGPPRPSRTVQATVID